MSLLLNTFSSSFLLDAVYYSILALGFWVGFNIFRQLALPKDPTLPPEVFHYLPWVGSAVDYGMNPYDFFTRNQEKYGNVFTFVLAGKRITVALTPAGSDMILNGKLANVSAEDAYTHLTTPVFGTEVVYDCPNHLLMQQKKFMKFGLSTENFIKYIPIVVDEVQQYITKYLQPALEHNHPVDAYEAASQITICTAAATLQGSEVRSRLDTSFAQLFHELDGGFTPLHWVLPGLPLPSYRKRDRANLKMTELYSGILAQRREAGTLGDHSTTSDMIQALAGQSYKDGTEISDKQIAHMMIALLMAGQHTSSATTSWSILHLGQDTEYQQKLYDEQVAVYGNPDGTFRPLDYDSLQSPLLAASLREVLRMHPPIHSIMREVHEPLPVPSKLAPGGRNFVIPRGYTVMASPGQSARDPAFFDRPNVFDPSRWINKKEDDVDGLAKEDFGFGMISTGANSPYLPFGAGRHRCIGEQFAYLQINTILATLIRQYKWKLESPAFPQEDYTTMLVAPKDPRTIILESR